MANLNTTVAFQILSNTFKYKHRHNQKLSLFEMTIPIWMEIAAQIIDPAKVFPTGQVVPPSDQPRMVICRSGNGLKRVDVRTERRLKE
jgi:hypothetical protein